jgi:orotate phosphoribosyltransferase
MDDLARRIRLASKLSGNFTPRSGRVSNTYFDKYRFESDPALLLAIANAMAPLIPSGSDALAGLEMGGMPPS